MNWNYLAADSWTYVETEFKFLTTLYRNYQLKRKPIEVKNNIEILIAHFYKTNPDNFIFLEYQAFQYVISSLFKIYDIWKFKAVKQNVEIIEFRYLKDFNERCHQNDLKTLIERTLDQYNGPNKSWNIRVFRRWKIY